VETTPGKGIEIAISELSGASDCSTNYLEVRLGDNNRRDTNGAKIEAPLVGKYCSTAGTVKFNNFKIWVKWVRPSASLATSTLKAKWTTFAGKVETHSNSDLITFCSGLLRQNVYQGQGCICVSYICLIMMPLHLTYPRKQTNTVKDYPVYKAETENGHDFMFFIHYAWRVGRALPTYPTPTTSSYSMTYQTEVIFIWCYIF
jgi:hypothetical protein